MSKLSTAIAAENEIMKAVDFTFGYDSSINNIAVAMKSILSGSETNYVIGGKVSPFKSGGLNVTIAPLYAFSNESGMCVAETDTTEPISFEEADSSLDRIDIIEVQGSIEGYDKQGRMFNDPSTGMKTVKSVFTKNMVALKVVVKKGANGSAKAPLVDSGFIKLAEVIIPAGTVNITDEMIKNVTARKGGTDNKDWTVNKNATFNPSYLSDIFYTYLTEHEENGAHKNSVIKSNHIDFGTGERQINSAKIPIGQSVTIKDEDFSSLTMLNDVIAALSENVNNLYSYSNTILSRYDFDKTSFAASSTENVDVAIGGEKSIDGVLCRAGQIVFLKNQTEKIENGFWVVQTGAWNRAENFVNGKTSFNKKFILIDTGNTNKGKIFYLPKDNYLIGSDELDFTECFLSPYALSEKVMIRDKNGRAKVNAPIEDSDIAIKKNITDLNANLNNHGDSCDGRNLLEVLNVATIEEAMDKLHIMCNGENKPDWSLIQIGDYLDLPSLTVGSTTYTNNSSYQNLRIVVSGFNQYKQVGDTENTKNHILWTFRNCVLQKRVNATDTNAGGYAASELKKYLDGDFANGLKTALGNAEYLYTIRRNITKKGSTAWLSDTVFLPTEVEVFGTPTYGDDQIGYNTNVQYPIFRNSSFYRLKRYNGSRAWWWEATSYAASSAYFCVVDSGGRASAIIASISDGGVAPAFCTC